MFITLTSGILVSILDRPYFVHVRFKEMIWPPPSSEIRQSDSHVGYTIHALFEMWNPYKKTFAHHTPHSNLLDPQMEVEFEENYTATSYYIYLIVLSTYKIRPGMGALNVTMYLSIIGYNDSYPQMATILYGWILMVNRSIQTLLLMSLFTNQLFFTKIMKVI